MWCERGIREADNPDLAPSLQGPHISRRMIHNYPSISSCDHYFLFVFSYDININRHPVVIAEAKCDIARCVDAEGKVDNSLNSVAIQQEILVLHREMTKCTPVFKLEKKIVTVGCTCVRPTIQEQQ